MGLMEIHLRSKCLSKSTTVRVLVNEHAKPPYPVYYLLHGYSDDATNWTRNTRLEHYAGQYPFLIVMPDGEHSFYCDSRLGEYETFIVKELRLFIEKTFQVKTDRTGRAIGGLSMGGYGSMKLALKYPDLFGAVASHSSAFQFAHDPERKVIDRPKTNAVLEDIDFAENNVHALAEKCPKRKRPALYFDCGREDFLYQDNQAFQRTLKKLKFPHTYKRFKGSHNWDYWDEHIQDALVFVAKALKVKTIS